LFNGIHQFRNQLKKTRSRNE